MTHFFEEQATLVPGGFSGVEIYDALDRERVARASAEATSAELAGLLASEHARIAAAELELDSLREQLATQSERARMLASQLSCAMSAPDCVAPTWRDRFYVWRRRWL